MLKCYLEILFLHQQRVFRSQEHSESDTSERHRLSTASPRACLFMPLLNSYGRPTAWSNKWVTSACVQPGLSTRSHWNSISPVACRQSVTIPVKFIYQYWQQPHHTHYDQCCRKCFGCLRLGWALILLLPCTSVLSPHSLNGRSQELNEKPDIWPLSEQLRNCLTGIYSLFRENVIKLAAHLMND